MAALLPVRIILETGQAASDSNSFVDIQTLWDEWAVDLVNNDLRTKYKNADHDPDDTDSLAYDQGKLTRLLILSAIMLRDSVLWNGYPTDKDQALPFPRYGLVDSHGRSVPSDEIPFDIKYAQVLMTSEIARSIMRGQEQKDDVFDIGALRSVKDDIGGQSTEYHFQQEATDRSIPSATAWSLPVRQLLEPYGEVLVGSHTCILRMA